MFKSKWLNTEWERLKKLRTTFHRDLAPVVTRPLVNGKRVAQPSEPRVLDFSANRGWDNDYYVNVVESEGLIVKGGMWATPGPKVGDYLILKNRDRYRIIEVARSLDPGDMYHYTAAFDPRVSNPLAPQISSPCRHCGTVGVAGEDHSCTCPYSDADCPSHQATL